jgi:glutathione-regulated potassium-efflux system protein KefB
MAVDSQTTELVRAVALLGSAVVAVPLFKRLGLGSVVGYLAAGLVIGPFGLKIFRDPTAILAVAEFGVVLLLFVIGLELKPSRLWSLRRDIFGLGLAQVLVSMALLTGAGVWAGFAPAPAFVAAAGLAMSSTAIVMQILEERGDQTEPYGRRIFSILLFQDLAIVPLLAIIAVLAPIHTTSGLTMRDVILAVAGVATVVLVGRYLLNPLFRIFADSKAREVMTAAALLVVLGSALLMHLSGLSMAMGAFIAGVLLSESSFRNQLEADIEPFRGLLLGLFFLSVGMSLDLSLIAGAWPKLLALVVVFMVLKTLATYIVARLFRAGRADALRLALMLAQGGEFAFVLFTTAVDSRILDRDTGELLTAAVIVSMALTPLAPILLKWLLPQPAPSMDGVQIADGLSATALIIGFGRFGQVASQALLSRGIDASIIDADTDMIRAAARFGFQIYYGDGTRLDVLRAAGAGRAKIIAICIDNRAAIDRIVELAKAEFPLATVLARSYDRGHTLDLIQAGVDYQIRETFESALVFGKAALVALGVADEDATEAIEDIRHRDAERLAMQIDGGIAAGRHLTFKNQPQPTPLTPPKREAKPLSAETAVVAAESEETEDAANPSG